MTSFLSKLKSQSTTSPNASSSPSKKDAAAAGPTPLERMLLNAGPIRNDGTDKFWGMENVSTLMLSGMCFTDTFCAVWKYLVTLPPTQTPLRTDHDSYCNSILQCLYYSAPFRENILAYPRQSLPDEVNTAAKSATPRPPLNANGAAKKPGAAAPGQKPNNSQPQKPEDKDSPEYKKKQALMAGPILNMSYQNATGYEMPESLFTSLKDIFEAVVVNQSRNGIVSPTKLLEVLRKENEMFRSAMHQDAHEFLNLLLNAVMENIEAHDKVVKANEKAKKEAEQDSQSIQSEEEKPDGTVSFPSILPVPSSASPAKWLHELFEGTLTSETRCLTCENTSQRDEPFLDLSVDLEQHSSVTACLRRFSEEEMLCERNKFHCDNCGGLQEAEKRMKLKRLPKVLALHLKRFKYTEDLQRLQKLFHKVVYPYHLRLFNTTDDAEDPDRLYELYAVVVHIGGGPYHGHYVSIIKTQDRGWLLFDDEMVEPVDKSYVRNFFGDKAGLACAYVLFYQETTLEAVQKEQRMEGKRRASQDGIAGLGFNTTVKESAELHRVASDPVVSPDANFASLAHAATAPPLKTGPNGHVDQPPLPKSPVMPIATAPTSVARPTSPIVQSKKEKQKEEKAQEKARKAAEKQAEKDRQEQEKEKRKQLSQKLSDAHKKQEADLKAAMEASKQSKAEDDQRRGGVPGEKENQSPANGNGGSPASGLDRFRRSKSLRFGSLSKKDKKEDVKPPATVLEKASLTRSVTENNLGGEKGEMDSTTALVDDEPQATAMTAGNGNGNGEKVTVSMPEMGNKDGGEGKEKKNRFSIRKKSFGMLS